MDQARGRGRGRHDGSHRLRRDAVRRTATGRGSRKRAPCFFQVQVILLGTAAGGGFPQWNCWCPTLPGRAPRAESRAAPEPVLGRRQRRRAALVSAQRLARTSTPSSPDCPAAEPAGIATCRSRASSSPTPSWITRSASCCCARGATSRSMRPQAVRPDRGARLADPPGHSGLCRGAAGDAAGRRRDAAVLPRRWPERPDRSSFPGARRAAPVRRRGSPGAHGRPAAPRRGDRRACAFVPGCGGLDQRCSAGSVRPTWSSSTAPSGPMTS